MKRLYFLNTALFLVATAGLSAQSWQLIDDFSDNTFDKWIITASKNVIGEHPWFEDGDEAFLELINPEGFPADAALNLETGAYGKPNVYGDTWAICPLPINPGDNTDSTFYFQYYQQGGNNAFHIGLTALEAVPLTAEELEAQKADQAGKITKLYSQPGDWGHMNLLFRLVYDNLFDVRDGNKYRLTSYGVESYTWYEVWMVVHNRDGAFQAPDGDTFEIWIKGGEYTEPTRVMIPPATAFDGNGDPNPDKEAAVWRVPSSDPLRYVILASQSGDPLAPNDGDPHLIDDLYITEGVHVETPPNATLRTNPESWNGFLIHEADGLRWVDTGDVMGALLLHSSYPDSAWVYSYSLAKWVWANDEFLAERAGGWVYVP